MKVWILCKVDTFTKQIMNILCVYENEDMAKERCNYLNVNTYEQFETHEVIPMEVIMGKDNVLE